MRYRVTNGLIDYLKSIYDKVVYASVDEAYEEYEDTCQLEGVDEVSKYPALVSLHRTSCTPKSSSLTRSELRNGRYVAVNRQVGTENYVASIEWDIGYDVTVLSSKQINTDTLVDELVMYIAARGTFTYDTGCPSPLDPSTTLLESVVVRLVPGGLGEIYENEDTTENGTIYRTTFQIELTARTYKFEVGKKLNSFGSGVTADFAPTS
jgi:hypothetical protein